MPIENLKLKPEQKKLTVETVARRLKQGSIKSSTIYSSNIERLLIKLPHTVYVEVDELGRYKAIKDDAIINSINDIVNRGLVLYHSDLFPELVEVPFETWEPIYQNALLEAEVNFVEVTDTIRELI